MNPSVSEGWGEGGGKSLGKAERGRIEKLASAKAN